MFVSSFCGLACVGGALLQVPMSPSSAPGPGCGTVLRSGGVRGPATSRFARVASVDGCCSAGASINEPIHFLPLAYGTSLSSVTEAEVMQFVGMSCPSTDSPPH